MLDYNTNSRQQAVRDRAELLASEMRHSRPLRPDEAGYPGWGRLGSALVGRVERLRHRRQAPAYQA